MLEAAGITRRGDDGRLLLDHFDLVVAPGDRLALSGAVGIGQIAAASSTGAPRSARERRGALEGLAGGGRRGAEVPQPRHLSTAGACAPRGDGGGEPPPAVCSRRESRSSDSTHSARPGSLAELGRPDLESRPTIGDLSGGEQQIIALVRVLLLDPIVLLLDEPTAALDPDAERRVIEVIGSWASEAAEGRALVWVSHDDRVVDRVATRALTLDQGRLESRSV